MKKQFEEKCFSDSNKTRLLKYALWFINQKINIIQDIQLVPPCHSQKATTSIALATENIIISKSILETKLIGYESNP